jgi:hypothetical protein
LETIVGGGIANGIAVPGMCVSMRGDNLPRNLEWSGTQCQAWIQEAYVDRFAPLVSHAADIVVYPHGVLGNGILPVQFGRDLPNQPPGLQVGDGSGYERGSDNLTPKDRSDFSLVEQCEMGPRHTGVPALWSPRQSTMHIVACIPVNDGSQAVAYKVNPLAVI